MGKRGGGGAYKEWTHKCVDALVFIGKIKRASDPIVVDRKGFTCQLPLGGKRGGAKVYLLI